MTKFKNKTLTAKNEPRAFVGLKSLKTLWFNTGTQCNLACGNCYIESSPQNDRLIYLTQNDITPFLAELTPDTDLIAFTGGEPFINPNMISLLESSLETGRDVLVLTNAFNILKRHHNSLLSLKESYHHKLHLRISLDHHTKIVHEKERGVNTFDKTLVEIKWLFDNGFNISIAGRSLSEESMADSKQQYSVLLIKNNVNINLHEKLVIFPEMISGEDVPEISTACWDILSKSPDDQMCASERMIVRRKGSEAAVVLPCTLLAYDREFELGDTLESSEKDVYLNHEFCAKFCVLGGASCSSTT